MVRERGSVLVSFFWKWCVNEGAGVKHYICPVYGELYCELVAVRVAA
jgi:hypothetical protein